ncbi:MAG: ABC transporter substrate-binding protein [Gammaproteobacteria bacterium]|nr:ABC transporter substrate-binding protein [Gammaproteobacteria bacterium]
MHRTLPSSPIDGSRRFLCSATLLLAAGALGLVLHGPARASETAAAPATPSAATAQLLVEDTTARVIAAMSRERERDGVKPELAYDIVARIVMPNIDLDRTSRLVLGEHWARATDAQRARFKQVFGNQLIRTYVLGLADYLAVSGKIAIAIDYLPGAITKDGRVAVVRSRVAASSVSMRIDYRLHRVEGAWRVFDVLVEGVSVASTYRSSFMAEASRNGIDRLIERIAEKNRRPGAV